MDKDNRSTTVYGTALIVEGGAMRSIFSAGLLDRFLQEDFDPFDFYIGISAGAGNLAAFLSGTPRKSLGVYLDLALRKEFIDYRRFLRGGHLIDLDWLFAESLSRGWLDIPAVFKHGKPLYVGVTELASGEAELLRAGPDNLADIIKASTALPLFYRGFPEVDGRPMTDGGIADGIPVRQAIRLGATRIMVVRSRPSGYRKRDTWVHRYIRWKLRRHTRLVAAMRQRVERHAAVAELIRRPPLGVAVVDVCPPDDFVVGRFSRDRHGLLQGYRIGFEAAEDAMARWRRSAASVNCPQRAAPPLQAFGQAPR
jgi:predicted patatin/cPLA2 family phospholipase